MKHEQCTEDRFLKDIATHQLDVVLDNGLLYRHLRFRRPGSYCMGFDIITWPGYLAYCGDMGAYTFTRVEDMFTFFRDDRWRQGQPGLHINPGYWSQKCVAADRDDGITEYDADLFRERILEWLNDIEADDELRQAVHDEILPHADDGEALACAAVYDFGFDGRNPFQDFFEVNLRVYTLRFLWCCYALAWGIGKYDEHKAKAVSNPTCPA